MSKEFSFDNTESDYQVDSNNKLKLSKKAKHLSEGGLSPGTAALPSKGNPIYRFKKKRGKSSASTSDFEDVLDDFNNNDNINSNHNNHKSNVNSNNISDRDQRNRNKSTISRLESNSNSMDSQRDNLDLPPTSCKSASMIKKSNTNTILSASLPADYTTNDS
eukprot:Awhi_evm1s8495